MMNNGDPIIYEATDLMRILRVGKNAAYNLMNDRNFPSFRVGRKLFVTQDAFEEWANKGQKNK